MSMITQTATATAPMHRVLASMSDDELRQLAHLLAASATPGLLDLAIGDIEAIGAELWRRQPRPAIPPLA